MQVTLLFAEVLQCVHCLLEILLRADKLFFALGQHALHVCQCCQSLQHRLVGVLHEALVRSLSVAFGDNSFRCCLFDISQDGLKHRHNATAAGICLVFGEPHRRVAWVCVCCRCLDVWCAWLLEEQVHLLHTGKSLLQDHCHQAVVRNGCLEFCVFSLTRLRGHLHLLHELRVCRGGCRDVLGESFNGFGQVSLFGQQAIFLVVGGFCRFLVLKEILGANILLNFLFFLLLLQLLDQIINQCLDLCEFI
mmetsp:Transcript_42304/g.79210  ORF Transcript_42304/g.79210 Transcript_42304/m.79210 type:complete len:249 (-) Transcript_42304:1296-2042(-)